MKPQHSYETILPSLRFSMHNESRTIFKPKPKIRIIHIVAPEIITTDVQNFRELVQNLTGKPAESTKKKGKNVSSKVLPLNKNARKPMKNVESSSLLKTQRMKKESDEINEADNPNSYLRFLGDVDGFIHDMNEIPLHPYMSSQINT